MNLALFILSAILMSCNVIWIIFFTEMIQDQHWAQKIFYIHVPLAWVGFLSYFFVMVAGISYLFSKDLKYDRIGHAAAEIGTLFTGLVLVTGPIWATPVWGQPWVWEPRLITTLVLFLVYVGYFIFREAKYKDTPSLFLADMDINKNYLKFTKKIFSKLVISNFDINKFAFIASCVSKKSNYWQDLTICLPFNFSRIPFIIYEELAPKDFMVIKDKKIQFSFGDGDNI